jgi:hypothetical protein
VESNFALRLRNKGLGKFKAMFKAMNESDEHEAGPFSEVLSSFRR